MRSSMKSARIIAVLMALIALFTVVLTSCGEPAVETTYTVTFDADNGSAATTVEVNKGEKITAPTAPEKEGYNFLGWYLADTEWEFDTWTVKSDMTLVAQWQEKDPFDYYTSMSIKDARAAEKGTQLKVSGVVANIGYAFGMVPSGFMLVDGESSIYVYDKTAAAAVVVGNKVEIAAIKDYWILDDEKTNAEKFGYQGANQLANVTILSNDKKTDNNIDLSWASESTIKELMNAPFTDDITSLIFKVNALVVRDQQTGFVNYYFDDLDGVTGTYTYTQCNGSDFAWLDQFDGKICTVYITAINAKSTASGCVYRVVPVSVSYDNYKFDETKTPEFVLEYVVRDQFKSSYTGNPKTELTTVASSELLGFEGATITYTSDNESIVKITVEGDKVYLDVVAEGKANVTATVTYGDFSKSMTFVVERVKPTTDNALSVSEAIAAELKETVTVTGIVGPSLVNKVGFYLIDEGGVIAIVVNEKSELDGLSIGDEIILTGTRDKFHNGNGDWAGQTCITAATIDANLYGTNKYSTESFVTGKTASDFYALDVKVDYSTTVFVMEVTVVADTSGWNLQYKLSDGTSTISLYNSGPAQYEALLAQFVGQTVTVEVAACNWNNKTYWAGCVLSVTDAEGNTVYNTLNFD